MNTLTRIFYGAMLRGLGEPIPEWVPHMFPKKDKDRLLKFVDWQLTRAFHLEGGQVTQMPERLGRLYLNILVPSRHRLVICLGAGVDSTIAVYYALKVLNYLPEDILVLHVNYSAPYGDKEFKASTKLFAQFRTLGVETLFASVDDLDNMGKPLNANKFPEGYIIPGRNSLLAAIGSQVGDEVWISANWRKIEDGTATLDKGRKFFGQISEILSAYHERTITVRSPFLHLTKKETVAWFVDEFGLDGAQDLLKDTVSCYSGQGDGRCGVCYSCFKAYRAFRDCGMIKMLGTFETRPEDGPQHSDFVSREVEKGRGA